MKERNQKLIAFIFSKESKSIHRKEYFNNDFLDWCFYYFPWEFNHPLAPFHFTYVETLEDWTDIFFVWFRECAKSMFLTMYYTWVILYRKRRYIIHYNSEIEQAKSMLSDVIWMLQTNEKIISDYWYAYIPLEWLKRWDNKKKTVWEFISETGTKMQAMSMWKSPRWKKFVYKWITYRPDLVWFDDLDNIKNTKNINIIESDIKFILWEVFWWVSSYCQKIFLWNVIVDIWRVPSLKKHFESDSKMWVKVFWIPIRIKWKITWDRFVATDKIAEEKNKNIADPRESFISLEKTRRDQWSIWFWQNYNLVAYVNGQKIINKWNIKYWYDMPENCRIVIWIDPAFSEKTLSDSIWIVATAHHTNSEWKKFKYILEVIELKWKEKNEDNFKNVVYELYKKIKANVVRIETNNWWSILARILKKANIAVVEVTQKQDKVQNLLEYQGDFERGEVYFRNDMSTDLENQLLPFPNVDHDDLVDWMMLSFKDEKIGWFSTSIKK